MVQLLRKSARVSRQVHIERVDMDAYLRGMAFCNVIVQRTVVPEAPTWWNPMSCKGKPDHSASKCSTMMMLSSFSRRFDGAVSAVSCRARVTGKAQRQAAIQVSLGSREPRLILLSFSRRFSQAVLCKLIFVCVIAKFELTTQIGQWLARLLQVLASVIEKVSNGISSSAHRMR